MYVGGIQDVWDHSDPALETIPGSDVSCAYSYVVLRRYCQCRTYSCVWHLTASAKWVLALRSGHWIHRYQQYRLPRISTMLTKQWRIVSSTLFGNWKNCSTSEGRRCCHAAWRWWTTLHTELFRLGVLSWRLLPPRANIRWAYTSNYFYNLELFRVRFNKDLVMRLLKLSYVILHIGFDLCRRRISCLVSSCWARTPTRISQIRRSGTSFWISS